MNSEQALYYLFNNCEIIYDMNNFNVEEYNKEQEKQREAINVLRNIVYKYNNAIERLELDIEKYKKYDDESILTGKLEEAVNIYEILYSRFEDFDLLEGN